jgi:hypothetical protein
MVFIANRMVMHMDNVKTRRNVYLVVLPVRRVNYEVF